MLDPIVLVEAIFCGLMAILGVSQIVTRKITGKKIEKYTDESVRKFALARGVTYLVGGILALCACFALKNPAGTMSSIIIIIIALPLAMKSSILKEK